MLVYNNDIDSDDNDLSSALVRWYWVRVELMILLDFKVDGFISAR